MLTFLSPDGASRRHHDVGRAGPGSTTTPPTRVGLLLRLARTYRHRASAA
ncbi:MAG: hypothetical protein IPH27_16235 [Actinomycetales bacterium]|nr:hypothetical protein [Candidatus Phosphoribacter baldrii]MBK6956916.1 hypothetical protein [Candidatus Phosphoribacter baldrii]